MDILFDKAITFTELEKFVAETLAGSNISVLYEGLNDWTDVGEETAVIHYQVNEELKSGLKYSLSLYLEEDTLELIEYLTRMLSAEFQCTAVCDASRIVLVKHNSYYSLLFENGQVYLVDDYAYDETGQVRKIVELNYVPPQPHT